MGVHFQNQYKNMLKLDLDEHQVQDGGLNDTHIFRLPHVANAWSKTHIRNANMIFMEHNR